MFGPEITDPACTLELYSADCRICASCVCIATIRELNDDTLASMSPHSTNNATFSTKTKIRRGVFLDGRGLATSGAAATGAIAGRTLEVAEARPGSLAAERAVVALASCERTGAREAWVAATLPPEPAPIRPPTGRPPPPRPAPRPRPGLPAPAAGARQLARSVARLQLLSASAAFRLLAVVISKSGKDSVFQVIAHRYS